MSEAGALRLEGSAVPRDLGRYPRGDDALGLSLFEMVAKALSRGRPAPAVFLFSSEMVDRFPYRGLVQFKGAARQRLLGAIAGSDTAECMAIIGAFRFSGRGPLNGHWVASVFIEWPDNRWWTAWQPLGPEGQLVGDSPQIRTAADGSPRPGGVGGWFALARRKNLRLRVNRDRLPVH